DSYPLKLLFDENLADRLIRRLADVYPESAHVSTLGLGGGRDVEIWDVAAAEGFILVTKDADFHWLSTLRGHPPKVIWIRLGNCSPREVEKLLRGRRAEILEFEGITNASFLALG